jgi:YVTN family beta-propeller protein
MSYCSELRSWKSSTSLGTIKFRRLLQLCWAALFTLLGFWSVPAAAQSYAYVPTHKSNSVSVINISTNSVIAVVPVGVQPLQAAISPDGTLAYVTDSGWFDPINDVSVISTPTNSVVATIPVGRFPVGVAITHDGAFAYVSNRMSDDVSVINTATNTMTATVAGVVALPEGLAIKP